MQWTGPQSPCLVKDGPFDEFQVKDSKSAATLTVFFYVRSVQSAIWYTFCYLRISGISVFSPLDK